MWLFTCLAAHAATIESVEVQAARESHGVVAGVVDVPVGQVLDLVTDCAGSVGWFPDLLAARVVASGSDAVRCEGATDLPWPLTDRTWQIDTVVEPLADGVFSVPFALVDGSGNLDELRGRYLLEDLGDGRTRVTYEAFVDLGFWVPEALAHYATKQMLPAILLGIESAAPTSLVAAR